MNHILIRNYEVMINEQNASCGLFVDIQQYNLSQFIDQELQYSVDYSNHKVIVSNGKDTITFINADKQMLYYVIKSLALVILVGKKLPKTDVEYFLQAHLV